MFGDGDINDLVGLEERLKYGPALQEVAAKVNLFKPGRLGKQNFGTFLARSFGNAGALEAAARIVATDVGGVDFFCAGAPTLANQFRNDLGIGVGGLFGRAVPGDVWLHDDNVGARNEALYAAHFLERAPNQQIRFAARDCC
jgi:hypothetical protein